MKHLKLIVTACALGLAISTATAGFHFIQIEQFIGAVNGDKTAQAIQVRLRSGGQIFMSSGRIQAWDATGANPILLVDMTTDVTNGAVGDNVLLASANFNSIMTSAYGASYATDFTLTNLVPVSYLTGGKITFESNGGTIYWSLAFGAYTGTNLSSDTTNDADANYGAPTVAPPTTTGIAQGIRFTGAASALSTNNLADYALSANPATVRNNARNSFVVAPEPTSVAMLAVGGFGLAGLAFARRRRS